MKIKPLIKILIPAIFILIILWFVSSNLIGKKITNSDFKDFEISITRSNDSLKLISHQGSEWTRLGLKLEKNVPKTIDTYGKVLSNNIQYNRNPNEAYYCITIKKTYYGSYKLSGIEGTYWNELYFSLDDGETKGINREGLMKD